MLKSDEIQEILPQRYPFLLIDQVEVISEDKVIAVKNVSVNEPFFAGHFPGRPVMPGVLIIEAMAQAAIILFSACKKKSANKRQVYYLGNAKVRFLNPVYPGDCLKIVVEPLKMLSTAAVVTTHANVTDKEIARGEIILSVKDE